MEAPCAGPGCHARRSLVMCGGCRAATYCDAKCAERAWISGHAVRCEKEGNLAAGIFGFSETEKIARKEKDRIAAIDREKKDRIAAIAREKKDLITPTIRDLWDLADISHSIIIRLGRFWVALLGLGENNTELKELRGISKALEKEPENEQILKQFNEFVIPKGERVGGYEWEKYYPNDIRRKYWQDIKDLIQRRSELRTKIKTSIETVKDKYPDDVAIQQWVTDAMAKQWTGGDVVYTPQK